MQTQPFFMLSFHSTHDAIQAEKALKQHLAVQVIPTLRQVSQSCGISLRIEAADYPNLASLLQQQGVASGSSALYHVTPDESGRGLQAQPIQM